MIEAPEWNKLYSDKGTLIKKEFENNQPIKLKELRELGTVDLQENIFQKFVFEINIHSVDFSTESVFLYCENCKKFEKIFTSKELKCCGSTKKVYCLIKLLVNDSSLKLK